MCRYNLLSAYILIFMSSVLFASDVPVDNGDFEKGLDNWQGSGKIVGEERHSGEKSLMLENGHAFQPPNEKHLIPIEPDFDYKISIWIKATDMEDSLATVTGFFRGGQDKEELSLLGGLIKGVSPEMVQESGTMPALISTTDTKGWVKFEAGIPAEQIPVDAKALSIYLRHDAGGVSKGKAYFDDLAVERLPKGSLATVSLLQPNMAFVRNGGFESKGYSWNGNDWEVVEEMAAAGNYCIKMNRKSYAFQKGIQIKAGKRYCIKLKIRCEKALPFSAWLDVSYRGIGGAKGEGRFNLNTGEQVEMVCLATGGTHDWQEFSFVFTPPDGAERLNLSLHKKDDGGSVYFDDIRLFETDDPETTLEELRRLGWAPKAPLLNDDDFWEKELQNLGFEEGRAAWTFSDDNHIEVVLGGAQGSKSCLKTLNGYAMQGMRINGGPKFKISARIKTLGAGDDTVQVHVQSRSDNTTVISKETPIRTGGSRDWELKSAIIQVPPNTRNLLLYLKKNADDGIAWFDDVKVEPTEEFPLSEKQRKETWLLSLLPSAAPGHDNEALMQSAIEAAKKDMPSTLIFAKKRKTTYKIFTGSELLVSTRSIKLPPGSVLKSIQLQASRFEELPGDGAFRIIDFNKELPSGSLKNFTYEILVKDTSPSQLYRLGLRFKKADNSLSPICEPDWIRGNGTGWKEIKADFTSTVNSMISKGYTGLAQISLRVYNPQQAVSYCIDDVSLQMTDSNGVSSILFSNSPSSGKPTFGGSIVMVSESGAKEGFCRLSDGANPPKTAILGNTGLLDVNTDWKSPSSTIKLSTTKMWDVSIGQITYETKDGLLRTYSFEDIKGTKL